MRPRSAEALRWAGLCVALGALAVRAMTTFTPLPWWDADPLTFGAPMVGLGPAGSMVVDVLVLAGAAAMLLAEWLEGRRGQWCMAGLVGAGIVGVLAHGFGWGGLEDGGLANRWIGASWVSAMVLGLALVHACRDERVRRTMLAVVLGFTMVMAVKGAVQVFVEHPATVRDFEQNREALLASKGWSVDSSMARAYVRRLKQPEASGWFGLANVYATFAAAGAVGFVGVALTAWGTRSLRRGRRGGGASGSEGGTAASVIVLACVVGSIGSVWMCGSKGGVVAAAFGAGAFAFLWTLTRWRERVAGWRFGPDAIGGALGVVGVGAAIGLVVVRGWVGERIGELSLLFRWFYFQAAARIASGHPLAGVGPSGFQRAYLRAKNPLSPEEVSSPHCVLLEWWATLGLFGLAWAGVWLWWVWRAGTGTVDAAEMGDVCEKDLGADAGGRASAELRAVVLVAAAGTIGAAWMERAIPALDAALVRVVGLAVWCVVGWAVLRITSRAEGARWWAWRLGLAAAAITAAAHAQIDVTGTWTASAGLLAVVIGCAGAGEVMASVDGTGRAKMGWGPGAAAIGIAATVSAGWLPRAVAWERDLRAAALTVAPIGEINARLAGLGRLPAHEQHADVGEAAAQAARVLGRRVDPTPSAIAGALVEMERTLIPKAIDDLAAADALQPDVWQVRREASRLCLVLGAELSRSGPTSTPEARRAMDRAVEFAAARTWDGGSGAAMRDPAELGWLAVVYQERYARLGDREELVQAAAAMEEAATLDPYGLDNAQRLMRTYTRLGETDKARMWAKRTLVLDGFMRLDRDVRGLSPSDRLEAERLAGPGGAGG